MPTGLAWQKLSVPFSDAIAEHIDGRTLPFQRLRAAINAVFDKLGTIKKRQGMALVTGQSVLSGAPLYTTLTIGSAVRLVDTNGEPLLFDDRAVFGRSIAPNGFVMKGEHTGLTMSRIGLIRDQNEFTEDCDAALSSTGEWSVAVYTRRDAVSGERDLYYSAVSTVTGQFIVKDKLVISHISGTGPTNPRIMLVVGTLVCVYHNTTNGRLEAVKLD